MTQTYFFKPPIVGVFCYLQLNAFLADKNHSEKVFEPSLKGAGEEKCEEHSWQRKQHLSSPGGGGGMDTGSSSTMRTFQLLGQR